MITHVECWTLPVSEEHAAVRASGDPTGGGWQGRGAGAGEGPLQEGVCIHSLQGDLLEAICFCMGTDNEERERESIPGMLFCVFVCFVGLFF